MGEINIRTDPMCIRTGNFAHFYARFESVHNRHSCVGHDGGARQTSVSACAGTAWV